MKSPAPRDCEDPDDYTAAVLRHETWADSERDFQRDKQAEEQAKEPAGITLEDAAWENLCGENWRTEN